MAPSAIAGPTELDLEEAVSFTDGLHMIRLVIRFTGSKISCHVNDYCILIQLMYVMPIQIAVLEDIETVSITDLCSPAH
jgi:hypothetical protein